MNLYIANLGAYNRGFLEGEWVTLPLDVEELQAVIDEILNGEGAKCTRDFKDEEDEEVAIHDYECDYMTISEYDNIFFLNELARIVEENPNAVYLLEVNGIHYYYDSLDSLVSESEDAYLIEGIENYTDLGYAIVEQFGVEIPKEIEYYFNYEAYGRDYDLDGGGYFVDGGYFVTL